MGSEAPRDFMCVKVEGFYYNLISNKGSDITIYFFALLYSLLKNTESAFSMAARQRGNCNGNPAGPSHSYQQEEPDVPSELNQCKFPTVEPADATTVWINQLKYIWGLCRLSIKLFLYMVNFL
jgi:hypothetical protein